MLDPKNDIHIWQVSLKLGCSVSLFLTNAEDRCTMEIGLVILISRWLIQL